MADHLILSSCFLFFHMAEDFPDCNPWHTLMLVLFCPVRGTMEQPSTLNMQWTID